MTPPSRRLEGRVGVVTGAGRGLGREVSRALAAEGMRLLVLARTGTEVRALADELEAAYDVAVLPAAVDVRDAEAVEHPDGDLQVGRPGDGEAEVVKARAVL